MGKHENGFKRVDRDFYPTPPWVIAALAQHVDLHGTITWEPACGDGRMAEALRLAGCAPVYTSDITDRGCGQNEVLDFISVQEPKLARFDRIITNPPFGNRGTLAVAFIEAGLRRIKRGTLLALLLPSDFDSAKSRRLYFADCPQFTAKIVLTKRIVWFERHDGIPAAPKEKRLVCLDPQPIASSAASACSVRPSFHRAGPETHLRRARRMLDDLRNNDRFDPPTGLERDVQGDFFCTLRTWRGTPTPTQMAWLIRIYESVS